MDCDKIVPRTQYIKELSLHSLSRYYVPLLLNVYIPYAPFFYAFIAYVFVCYACSISHTPFLCLYSLCPSFLCFDALHLFRLMSVFYMPLF